MTNAEPPAPVLLFTGFLGSGKTTVLARLMRHPELADTAVIVNEFGEVGLDHHLVTQGEEQNVVLLENGCLCCAAGDSLGETLTDLFHRRERGEIPAFSRVIIETTGMADPGPILGTLLADRVMIRRYQIAAVITMVDGVFGAAQLAQYLEAKQQVALADRIVLTKQDAADRDSALQSVVAALNPDAEVLLSTRGEIDPSALLAPVTATRIAPDDAHAHHTEAIDTIHLAMPEPISWEQYAALVRTLQETLGARLLRAKGLVRIAGEPGLQVVQGVQFLFAPPAPLGRETTARTGLVLIGEHLDRTALRAAFATCGVA